MTILDKATDNDLKEFLIHCAEYVAIDIDKAFHITKNFIKRHRGLNVSVTDIHEVLDIENRWYKSLNVGNPDYSVYSDPYYFCEVWLCWINYSRRYLRDISNKKSLFDRSIISDMENVDTIMDVGCGFAYTTVALKEFFPSSTVYGTNLKDTPQYKMAKKFEDTKGIKIVHDLPSTQVDLLLASEYFEHFQSPIDHLQDLLIKYYPRYLIIANTFSGKAIGHFNQYEYRGNYYDGKKMSKMFNNILRDNNYTKVETNCWNNRPSYWKKNQSKNTLENFL